MIPTPEQSRNVRVERVPSQVGIVQDLRERLSQAEVRALAPGEPEPAAV